MNYDQIHFFLQNKGDHHRAEKAQRFFKTGKGHYAENDEFIGIPMPDLRVVAKQFESLPHSEVKQLIGSSIHEERMLALLILIRQYKKDTQAVYQLYMDNLMHVNNWDLVDTSAHLIIGRYLLHQEKDLLLELAASPVMWYRRIAIVTTWHFIRNNEFDWTIKIATQLLQDSHDLIHKAVGWMLREVGERDESRLLSFLDQYSSSMPRTMLRYATEKLPEEMRKYYRSK